MTETTVKPRTAGDAERLRPASSCDVCGGPTYEMRCKVVCRRCGYTRDCSDP